MGFFDELGGKISKFGGDVAGKAKDTAEIMKLNSAISDEEKNINNSFYQIGKLYYETHTADHEAQFNEMFEFIVGATARIEEYKNRINVLKGMVSCPSCGAQIPAGTAFCSVCGKPMPSAPAPSQPENTVKCPACGSYEPKGMKFCTKCGNSLANAEVKTESKSNRCSCGAELVEGMAFCTNCGKPIESNNAPEPQAEEEQRPFDLAGDADGEGLQTETVEPQQAEPAPEPVVEESAGADTKICPRCNSSIPAGFSFCTVCGTPVGNVAKPQSEGRICRGCGRPVAPGLSFCTNCGTPVNSERRCPGCGKTVAPGLSFCTNCGRKI